VEDREGRGDTTKDDVMGAGVQDVYSMNKITVQLLNSCLICIHINKTAGVE
jgi:hypothetical protein